MEKCCETCKHMFGQHTSDVECCNCCEDYSMYDPLFDEEDTNGIKVQEG